MIVFELQRLHVAVAHQFDELRQKNHAIIESGGTL